MGTKQLQFTKEYNSALYIEERVGPKYRDEHKKGPMILIRLRERKKRDFSFKEVESGRMKGY